MNIHSTIPQGIIRTYDVSKLEYCNITSMCIKDRTDKVFSIPDNYNDLITEIISDIYILNSNLAEKDDLYCYMTIKKMFVQPRSFGNRDGWHIDGFLSDQFNFIWNDTKELNTQVLLGDFLLTEDHELSLNEMNEQSIDKKIIFLNENTLYELDQTCVHSPSLNLSSESLLRTFIKITFTSELFNGYGNAWNYKLPHIKPNKNRSEMRNHGVK